MFSFLFQVPDISESDCRSGFVRYTLYYASTGSAAEEIIIYDVASTKYTLTELDIFTEYTVFMTASNKDQESDSSDSTANRTLEESESVLWAFSNDK